MLARLGWSFDVKKHGCASLEATAATSSSYFPRGPRLLANLQSPSRRSLMRSSRRAHGLHSHGLCQEDNINSTETALGASHHYKSCIHSCKATPSRNTFSPRLYIPYLPSAKLEEPLNQTYTPVTNQPNTNNSQHGSCAVIHDRHDRLLHRHLHPSVGSLP